MILKSDIFQYANVSGPIPNSSDFETSLGRQRTWAKLRCGISELQRLRAYNSSESPLKFQPTITPYQAYKKLMWEVGISRCLGTNSTNHIRRETQLLVYNY